METGMSKIHFAKALDAWTALASALALMAVPAQARPYDGNEGGGRHGGHGGAQAQQQAGSGQAQQGSGQGWQGNWRGRGGDNANSGNGGGGGQWRSRSAEQRRSNPAMGQDSQTTVQPRWSGGNSGDGGSWGGRRDGWRARQSGDQAASSGWNGGNGGNPSTSWQGRNRAYADPDRNRTYRQRDSQQQAGQPQVGQGEGWRNREAGRDARRETWRAENRRDNREQRQTYRQGWRDGQNADTWRNGQPDGNWRNDGRRRDSWRNDGWRNDRRYSGNNDARRWNREWRRDRRYDWYAYRNHNRDVYRIGRYYAPYRNHYYSRLSIGFFLDSVFYSSRYWIDDPWMYRLPAVYGPYRWIRYYDDALLVDIYTGEVVDVINDFFW